MRRGYHSIAGQVSRSVRALLGRVASAWSRCFNSAWDFLFYLPCGGEPAFRRRCVEFISPGEGESILDVCCGTGDLAAVITREGRAGRLVGVDISRPVLDTARARKGCSDFDVVRACGDALPFRSSAFERCLVSFGLHHMPPEIRRKALAEIRRVLVPQGRMCVIDYNLPRSGPRRLAAVANVRLDRSEDAWQMVREGRLRQEATEAGFDAMRRRLTCQGMVQMVEMVSR